MTRIYIVRHCEAEGNIKRYFQGHTNGLPSEKGYVQLERLAERFADVHIDVIYSSPLTRAYETAQAINRGRGLEIQTDERLIEINGGKWEGVMWESFPELFPEETELWERDPANFVAPDGESMREVYERMSQAISDIAYRHPDSVVAVASHGCAIRCLLCWLNGKPLEQLSTIHWCDNTAVTAVDFDYDGRCRIVFENDASHLDYELSTTAHQAWWRESEEQVDGE